MTTVVIHRAPTSADCAISWQDPQGAMRQDVVTLPEIVRSSATHRGFARRREAFRKGYVARKLAYARTTNPHQAALAGWSRPLQRAWYAGWDLAKTTDETHGVIARILYRIPAATPVTRCPRCSARTYSVLTQVDGRQLVDCLDEGTRSPSATRSGEGTLHPLSCATERRAHSLRTH